MGWQWKGKDGEAPKEAFMEINQVGMLEAPVPLCLDLWGHLPLSELKPSGAGR